jgi:hypothetical protein
MSDEKRNELGGTIGSSSGSVATSPIAPSSARSSSTAPGGSGRPASIELTHVSPRVVAGYNIASSGGRASPLDDTTEEEIRNEAQISMLLAAARSDTHTYSHKHACIHTGGSDT